MDGKKPWDTFGPAASICKKASIPSEDEPEALPLSKRLYPDNRCEQRWVK